MVIKCDKCSSRPHSQDEIHGRGLRVHNRMRDKSKARCTVCGEIKSVAVKDTSVVSITK